ncbi:MAG: hypothetical protein ACYC61_32230, partial [Isosphaeraceae bacterium]
MKREVRFRIRDLMVLNGVVALVMAAGVLLGSFVVVGMLAGMAGLFIVLPVVLVEIYLYRRQNGLVYRWRHPAPRRPRFVPPTVSLAARGGGRFVGLEGLAEEERQPRTQTRLFESAAEGAGPPSRASLLLDVAAKLEDSGKASAASAVYRQVVDRFADSAEARTARDRLHAIAGREARTGDAGV